MRMIGYCRVSTKEQGLRRNGLEGQAEDIRSFAKNNGIELVDIVYETASAKLGHEGRQVLAATLRQAKQHGYGIIVSKLDRFSRSVAYIAAMMHTMKDDKIPFVVAVMGLDVDPFMMHMFAAIAENERLQIGARTKAALAQVKAKGKTLGQSGEVLKIAQTRGGKTMQKIAINFAETVKEPIRKMRARGMTQAQIADELNEYNTPTSRGGKWSATQVSRVERLLKMAL
jgi:DNA invertase Pin-like site-specific DNA recombinase